MLKDRVNISKIAKELAISPTTVSRAISGKGRVSEETKQKIADYLQEKQLVPNTREKRYTDVTTKIIGVTIPEEKEFAFMPYFQRILLSAYDFFSIRGYQIIPIKTSADNIDNLKMAVEEHVMDGVILSRRVDTMDEIEYLTESGVPFVVIGSIDDLDILQIEADDEKASFDLTNALLRMGYYKMVIMCGDRKHPITKKRYNGIMAAHVENYMVLDRKYVFYDTDTSDFAEYAVEKSLSANMDCILCMDDNICLNVLKILQKKNVILPKEIRLASLYNSNILASWSPSITCVNYDVDTLGKEASRILYTYLTEHKKLPKVVLGYEILMKESTN